MKALVVFALLMTFLPRVVAQNNGPVKLAILSASAEAGDVAEVPGLALVRGEPLYVFGAPARIVSLTFSNRGDELFAADIRARLLQTSSTTAARIGEWPWKRLELLPQQTVLASASVDFPAVNAKTRFLLRWLTGTNELIGQTEVFVYPTNLLAELRPMTEGGLGVFDPQDRIKPLLTRLKVDFADLTESGLDAFAGKLAIVGPFDSRNSMRAGLQDAVKALAKRNVAVVWLLPPPEKVDPPVPTFYTVMENTNAVVVVQAEAVARLADNPRAQLNLIYFCKLALKPEPLALPDFTRQP